MFKKIIYTGIGIILLPLFVSIFIPKSNPVVQTENTPTTEVVETEKIQTSPTTSINPSPMGYVYYSVTDVIDGDTIKVSIDGNIETLRLIGLDTPETVDPRKPVQCFGIEASKKAKELLLNKEVRIEKDPTQTERDKYGRLLVYVYRDDGLFYNKAMIELGYAHEYTYNVPYKYQVDFKLAQKTAQTALFGLWSPSTCNGITSPIKK